MKCVAHYSGGLSSHLAAHRAIEEYGVDNVTLLFADVKGEDDDLYRFIDCYGRKLEPGNLCAPGGSQFIKPLPSGIINALPLSYRRRDG